MRTLTGIDGELRVVYRTRKFRQAWTDIAQRRSFARPEDPRSSIQLGPGRRYPGVGQPQGVHPISLFVRRGQKSNLDKTEPSSLVPRLTRAFWGCPLARRV